MREQSKAAKRRFYDGNFHTRYFSGSGIDVGAGNDSLSQYINDFSKIEKITSWDKEDGDAQLLSNIPNNQFDFLHSSHCLEHMVNPSQALVNWIRVVKPGGYLIITVPDEKLYEHDTWPSLYNSDHKFSFSIYSFKSNLPRHINLLDLCILFSDKIIVEKIELITEFTNQSFHSDLTMQPNPECSIEMIWKKI